MTIIISPQKEAVGELDVNGSKERRREGIPLGGEEGIVDVTDEGRREGIPLEGLEGIADGTDEGRREGIPLGGLEGIADALGEEDALGALLTLGTKD